MPHTCAHTVHKQTAIEESEDSQCRDGTDTPTVCVPSTWKAVLWKHHATVNAI